MLTSNGDLFSTPEDILSTHVSTPDEILQSLWNHETLAILDNCLFGNIYPSQKKKQSYPPSHPHVASSFSEIASYSPRALGWMVEKICNKLIFSGIVQQAIMNDISKIPWNPNCGNYKIIRHISFPVPLLLGQISACLMTWCALQGLSPQPVPHTTYGVVSSMPSSSGWGRCSCVKQSVCEPRMTPVDHTVIPQ